MTTSLRVGVVLLAAGASTRMGYPKMLLAWGSTSVLGHHLETWRGLGAAQIGIVYSTKDPRLAAELDRLNVPPHDRILNAAPEQGMFSSIRAAAAWSGWATELTHWAVALGDQPHVRSETLTALLEFASARPKSICQATRAGRPRHPVIMPEAYFRQLAACDSANLKEFLGENADVRAFQETNDAALDLDLDTPADYDTAIRLYEEER